MITLGEVRFGSKERWYLDQVIKSNRISYGHFCNEFEKEFSKVHGCQFGVFVNSGTSALHIALAALKERYGWKDGDEVLVPAVTFVATSNIVLHNKMTPVFVDVDENTYNIDYRLIEQAITPRTRAIIPVHLTGLPAEMTAIQQICGYHGIRIIEDACEAAFADISGKKAGSFGDIGCFSTYVAHHITAGIGGVAITNDKDLAVRLRSLANHGRDSIYFNIDDDDKLNPEDLHQIVSKRFSFVSLGHSFRVTEFEAAIALAQLENYQEMVAARLNNAMKLTDYLSRVNDKIKLPYWFNDCFHSSWMMYPIVVKNEDKRGLVNFLEDHKIETRDLLPLINQPIYKKMFGNLEHKYPVARWLNNNGFYVGCHQYLSDADILFIADTIHKYFSK